MIEIIVALIILFLGIVGGVGLVTDDLFERSRISLSEYETYNSIKEIWKLLWRI